jgi:hypothetical protein
MPLLYVRTIHHLRRFCSTACEILFPVSVLAHTLLLGIIDTHKHSLVSLRRLGSAGAVWWHRPTGCPRDSLSCHGAPSRSSATIDLRCWIEPSLNGGYRDKPDDSSRDEELSGFFYRHVDKKDYASRNYRHAPGAAGDAHDEAYSAVLGDLPRDRPSDSPTA